MRVLHLLEAGSASGCLYAHVADLARAGEGVEHVTYLMGAMADHRLAARCGLIVARRLARASWRHPAAVLQVRRALRAARCDVLHSWNRPAGAIAAKLKPHYTAQVHTEMHGPATRTAPPAIDASRLRRDRSAVRREWGVEDETVKIVAVLGDPPGTIDTLTASLGVGLAAEAGRTVRQLISPRAGRFVNVRRMLETAGRAHRLIVDARADEPWRVLGACDIAVVMCGSLAWSWAVASGLPIVTTQAMRGSAWWGAGEGDDEPALTFDGKHSGELANRIMRLLDDGESAKAVVESARRCGAAMVTPSEASRRYAAAYRAARGGMRAGAVKARRGDDRA